MYTRLAQKLIVVGTALDGKTHKLNATNVELENGKQTMGRTDYVTDVKHVSDKETKLIAKTGKQQDANALKKINNSIGFKTMNLKSFFASDKKYRCDANGNKLEKNEKSEKTEKTEIKGEVKSETKSEKKEEVKKEQVEQENISNTLKEVIITNSPITNVNHANLPTNLTISDLLSSRDEKFKQECEYVDAKKEIDNDAND